MMQLVFSPASPFVRTVSVLIRETGLQGIETLQVATTPIATDPKVLAANPVGKIPALIRDDGPAIYDSRVISRYLNARAGADLYPEARLWEVLTLEATAHGIMEAAVLCVYEGRVRPEEFRYDGWVDAQWRKVTQSLDAVEARWMSHLSGPLDAAQIAMGCALGYLDFRHGDRGWRSGRPALSDWEDAFKQRPSMQDTMPIG